MQQAPTYDALVIGAGPAGATTALLLARAGWSVAVVEKSRFPRRKVCGEFMSATSLPVLHELGIDRCFLDRAGPQVRRVGLFAGDAVLSSAMPSASGAPNAWGRALGREHLDQLLLDAAVRAGATLWPMWSVVELQRGTEGHACTIAARDAGRELVARIVIAAHGSWERSAWLDQGAKIHTPSDLLAFKAHFTDCDLPADLMPLLVFPGGYGGMVTTDGGRVSLSCCIRRDELQRRRQPGQAAAEAVLRHIQDSCRGVRHALERARLDGAWLSAGPVRPGIREHYADGLFLVGNIAGEAHPIVAEGISMAMQSAWLLCRHLITHQDDVVAGCAQAEVGRAYAAEWAAWFGLRIRAAALFAHLAMRPKAAALVLPMLRRFPGILTLGAQLSGKTRQLVPAPAAHGP